MACPRVQGELPVERTDPSRSPCAAFEDAGPLQILEWPYRTKDVPLSRLSGTVQAESAFTLSALFAFASFEERPYATERVGYD